MADKKHQHPIDSVLSEAISLKLRRSNKRSIGFNLSAVQMVKLKMHGNVFVHSFEEQPNSIVYDDELPSSLI